MPDDGVVDHDVDCPEGAIRRLDEVGDLSGDGEIGAMVKNAHAVTVLDMPAPGLDLRRIAEAVQHDVAAFGREPLRHGVAQALRRAGDEGAFGFQHEVLSGAFALDDLEADVDADALRKWALGRGIALAS